MNQESLVLYAIKFKNGHIGEHMHHNYEDALDVTEYYAGSQVVKYTESGVEHT